MSEKTLDVTTVSDAKSKISDLKVFGNGDAWQLLGKASSKSQGWMKSTKALDLGTAGTVLQVTTSQGDNVAEAVVFLPGVEFFKVRTAFE